MTKLSDLSAACKQLWHLALENWKTKGITLLHFALQAEEQGRVFVRDSSAAVWSAAVRHGARTRGQHRHFRQRGQEGVPG